ncbi:nitroreductase/quinone reductase family protein [Pseudonocardia broussonetiae]|uniref:Nitroreductase family deazaflavin-dependent oxidoreductase n=1 Tax=Pseudonocardia broussonetiae TaxID=2736640 RepID=A0A6M6JFR8_9PSEU|nr:nitroreductase/quinone reductase family protein [Pseudonocardia broussonetiae]QJY45870.1 nitroreductase family deazaflavin-dependent oxidoreductase [Pseudonocardia broussonetiae]
MTTTLTAGPVDVSAMHVMHRAFRRDLARFAVAVPATPPGDRDAWERLGRRWRLFASVLHKHHASEDAGLWPLLRERATDPAARATLDAMEAEHDLVDPLLAACAAGFARGGPARDRLAVDIAALADALGAHLDHEEADALALVQTHLTQDDWARVEREHFAPAYGPRDLLAVLGWVLHDLPAEEARALRAASPWMRLAGPVVRRFDRSERRTFRHLDTGPTRADRALTVVSRHVAAAHTALLRATSGRVGGRFRGGEVLLLTVTGRRSGREFTVPLLHLRDGDGWVVAASNGGIDREPQWWLNLQAAPDAVVEVDGVSVPVVAAEVDGADRAALWDRLVAVLGAYDDYQAGVRRRIAVVRLSPCGSPSSSPRRRSRA